ncbi:MAG: hypothetical protein ABSB91_01135 [Sedimentisphaerales bacterium]|jgi:hypothetical protein
MNDKNLKPIRITDPTAIKLVHESAPKQNRSLANCAATAIVESLNKKRNPGQPSFLDGVIVKGSEAGESSEKT